MSCPVWFVFESKTSDSVEIQGNLGWVPSDYNTICEIVNAADTIPDFDWCMVSIPRVGISFNRENIDLARGFIDHMKRMNINDRMRYINRFTYKNIMIVVENEISN
ncbi:hypothetical protein POP12_221 [Pectobacterium phage POP12]|nr:hypothetical protein POP12_221 [Pectobacterium phage POP12]